MHVKGVTASKHTLGASWSRTGALLTRIKLLTSRFRAKFYYFDFFFFQFCRWLQAAMVPSCVSNYPTTVPSTVRPTSSRPSPAPVTLVPSPYPTTSSPTPPPTIPVLFYMGSYDFTMISRWNYLSGADSSFLRSLNATS